MSQPSAYIPVHSFVYESGLIPNFPGQTLDVEFQGIKTTTDQIRTNLKLIQRDDGAVANGAVGYDSLAPSLQTNGISGASAWTTGVTYSVGFPVVTNSNLYRCAIAHTAGTFATDLAAGKWAFVTAVTSGPQGAQGIQGIQGVKGDKGDTGPQGTSGTQYNFATYAAAQAASVPAGFNDFSIYGYYADGDGGGARYFRVTSQPSTPASLRTLDRFMPDGSLNGINGGWWQMDISGAQDVRKFGVKADGVTDSTTAFQNAITTTNVFVPPGSYVLTGDIQIPSNRHIWVQNGATVTNTGGRFTGYVPGGGNIDFQIDGVMSFPATSTRTLLIDWDANAGVPTRGLIEIGGTHASPAVNIRIRGTGHVYSDYVWPGTPPTGFSDINYQLNRKGICIVNANKCLVEGLEVSNVYGEAIYWQGLPGSSDVKFIKNNVHEVAFNALNFNSFGAQGFLMAHNYIQNAWQGIEMSVGAAANNHILSVTTGILTGAGGGAGPISITNNQVVNCNVGYDIEFSPSVVEQVVIAGNQAISCNASGYILYNVSSFQLKDNLCYRHAITTAGIAFNIAANTSSGHIDGNIVRAPGAFSTGNVVNSAGAANTVGTNPVF
ncbi:glycosyl hydrolase family 28-related protein [Bradyrhizobium canariense]|uniref:Rhamnogalacturonase A/B/Epimerase-like pectate lyase domain-containing protein n=1 Tax=Bradyrhizobium canariense TaxID=255045 RepID=A0A1X3H592_9BRAD|nr:glycosyl hydrolase family 28-related protein [Bradyrhizobium canariense]OSI69920.1 hypothetical protein BSZ22_15845 [Bradyrhizobium canariense]OSI74936.1 hypothetical protein BSZ23_32100 [Bradyrhizobium canariense]OSI83432.1 hypothetical protein BSZ24_36610 [Bradyrhizobium canariense]OSI86579.1 hypothetical protein BSZ25_30675 [Bradyrhizobium canariense]OSI98462.1 hypothetical protein BSZ16_31760 [Bradyrhizobium canariense]